MALRDAPIAEIMNNIADVIEGGNAYRGSGTAYTGVATVQASRRSADYPTVTATHTGSTTTVKDTSRTEPTDFWARTRGVPLYLYCTSGTSGNLYRWRKITGWNTTTSIFTTSAWPSATATSDVFSIREGFKYLSEDVDIYDEAGDQDRVFDIILGGFGQGMSTSVRFGETHIEYQTTFTVRVRYNRQERLPNLMQRMYEDAILLNNALTDNNNRGATIVIDIVRFLGHNVDNGNEKFIISNLVLGVVCKTKTREG